MRALHWFLTLLELVSRLWRRDGGGPPKTPGNGKAVEREQPVVDAAATKRKNIYPLW